MLILFLSFLFSLLFSLKLLRTSLPMKKLLPHFTLALHATINVSLIKTGDHDSAGTEDVAERLEVEVADHRPSDESSIASMSPTAMETAIEGANLMIPRLEREIEVVDRQLSEEKAITMILQNDNKTSMATIARQAEELEMYRLEISRKKKELESQAREIVGLRNFSSTSSEKVILAVKSLQTTHQDQLRKLCSHATKDIDNLKEEKEETETEIKKTRKAELQSKDEQAQEVSKLRQKIINNEETHAIEIWTLQQELADTRVIGKMAASANTEPAPQGVSKLGTETKVAAEVDTAEMIGITVGKEKERTAEKKVSLSASGEEAPFTRPEVPIDMKNHWWFKEREDVKDSIPMLNNVAVALSQLGSGGMSKSRWANKTPPQPQNRNWGGRTRRGV